MSAFIELIGQFASAATDTAGVVGGGAATYVWRRFRRAEKAAHLGKAIAERAWTRVVEIDEKLETFAAGMRMEFMSLKEALARPVTQSRPDFSIDDNARLRVELLQKIEELRSEVLRERGQRHALQSQIANQAREDSQRWLTMTAAAARIEGGFDLLRDQVMSSMRSRM